MKTCIKDKNIYYDGAKLLSMNDINGEKPEIYIVTSNRTAGKTTYFYRLAINSFLKRGKKFGLIVRYGYELKEIEKAFFKDIQKLFFPKYDLIGNTVNDTYKELYLGVHELTEKGKEKTVKKKMIDYELCGYVLPLNKADNIKKLSHNFSDVDMLIFDEFQSETNKYCQNEIQKFYSLHTSVARGNGAMVRHVPVYMISNPVTLLNPYYTVMGINTRINAGTKFLKGDGWILENHFNAEASKANEESAFNRAFKKSQYGKYANEGRYLLDNAVFIEDVKGRGLYRMSMTCDSQNFGIYDYPNEGITYVCKKYDDTFPFKVAVSLENHSINHMMISRNMLFVHAMRKQFQLGNFRFQDLECKNATLKLLSFY